MERKLQFGKGKGPQTDKAQAGSGIHTTSVGVSSTEQAKAGSRLSEAFKKWHKTRGQGK